VLRTLRGVGRLADDTETTRDPGTDTADRWCTRLDGIVAALDNDSTGPAATGPRLPPSSVVTVSDSLVGLTLTDAISTIVSLDVTGTAVGGHEPGRVGTP
jgi:hypothetical protein